MKLQRFLERLPESTAVIKLKTGSATKQVLEAIFVIEGKEPKMQTGDLTPEYLNFDNAESIIVEEGENLGWGEDFTHIRLHAYDEDMNHLKSLSLPRTLKTNESDSVGPDQAIAALTAGMLQMSAEVRRTLTIVTESLAHRESMQAEIIESLLEAKRDQAEWEARHMHLENYLDEEGMRESDSFRTQAVQQLGEILQAVMGAKNMTPSVQDLKNWIAGNPDLLNTMFEDSELMDSVIAAYMARQASQAPPAE